eukprot:PhM_4_TR2474/c0_g1_i10/m.6694
MELREFPEAKFPLRWSHKNPHYEVAELVDAFGHAVRRAGNLEVARTLSEAAQTLAKASDFGHVMACAVGMGFDLAASPHMLLMVGLQLEWRDVVRRALIGCLSRPRGKVPSAAELELFISGGELTGSFFSGPASRTTARPGLLPLRAHRTRTTMVPRSPPDSIKSKQTNNIYSVCPP